LNNKIITEFKKSGLNTECVTIRIPNRLVSLGCTICC